MEEEQLINGIIARDEQVTRSFIENYQSLVINTCRGFVGNNADAEDIAQDVFIEVIESINTFRMDSKLSTWLYRIAVNKSLNHIKKNKRRSFFQNLEEIISINKTSKFEESHHDSEHPLELFEKEERKKIINTAINSLSANQKIAFTLLKTNDMSYKEIAEVMNVSVSSVESLIHRAKINLQKKLVRYYSNQL